ncbi:unnamed protein product [Darwinula stevensoni]|uniref:Structure-specific endonuclease subunit SLX4 n=1 Tax=Darwinula stevensoni TaxID=69355 RepID=A0A7R8XGM5_9CRUS|nr:unnamed protein product [Darwinula stevensoni]CAG0891834.1 unnamed protein product [Darwinula stevensoni]
MYLHYSGKVTLSQKPRKGKGKKLVVELEPLSPTLKLDSPLKKEEDPLQVLVDEKKQCPACSSYVLLSSFRDHRAECLQKFTRVERLSNSVSSSCRPAEFVDNPGKASEDLRKELAQEPSDTEGNGVPLLECPLCRQTFFSSTSCCIHIKKCGARRGLSSEQVLAAVKLHKKQALERKALGLPIKLTQKSKKPMRERCGRGQPQRVRNKGLVSMEPDLETAIALSASLHEEETRNKEKEQVLLANGYDEVAIEGIDVDMKCLSEAEVNKPVAARGRPRKNKFRGGLFALSLTSDEERKLKTSERATQILMEMVEACDRKVHEWHGVDIPSTPLFGLKPSSFHQNPGVIWSRAALNCNTEDLYVPSLLNFIQKKSVLLGQAERQNIKIPGRKSTLLSQHLQMRGKGENADGAEDVQLGSADEQEDKQCEIADEENLQLRSADEENDDVEPSLGKIHEEEMKGINLSTQYILAHLDAPVSQVMLTQEHDDVERDTPSQNREASDTSSKNSSHELVLNNPHFSSQMLNLLHFPEFKDVNFTTRDGEVGACEAVIWAQSQQLWTEIQQMKGTKTKKICCLEKYSSRSVMLFFEYLYTGKLSAVGEREQVQSEVAEIVDLYQVGKQENSCLEAAASITSQVTASRSLSPDLFEDSKSVSPVQVTYQENEQEQLGSPSMEITMVPCNVKATLVADQIERHSSPNRRSLDMEIPVLNSPPKTGISDKNHSPAQKEQKSWADNQIDTESFVLELCSPMSKNKCNCSSCHNQTVDGSDSWENSRTCAHGVKRSLQFDNTCHIIHPGSSEKFHDFHNSSISSEVPDLEASNVLKRPFVGSTPFSPKTAEKVELEMHSHKIGKRESVSPQLPPRKKSCHSSSSVSSNICFGEVLREASLDDSVLVLSSPSVIGDDSENFMSLSQPDIPSTAPIFKELARHPSTPTFTCLTQHPSMPMASPKASKCQTSPLLDNAFDMTPLPLRQRIERKLSRTSIASPPKASSPSKRPCNSVVNDTDTDRVFKDLGIDESFIWAEENAPELPHETPQPKSCNRSQMTSNVTPTPDFRKMDTPALQKELRRFGVRQLSKQQAVKLLQYIYEETHPVAHVEPVPSTSCAPTQHKAKDEDDKDVLDSEEEDADSEEIPEESMLVFADSPVKNQSKSTKKTPDELKEEVRVYFLKTPDLLRKALLYEPIWIETLRADLKQAGIKISIEFLMDFLDEQREFLPPIFEFLFFMGRNGEMLNCRKQMPARIFLFDR